MNIRDRSSGATYRYWMLAGLVLLVAVAGYTGYVLYPRFDLAGSQGLGLSGLAVAAGVASFFSPCSFPLLLTLLTAHTSRTSQRTGTHPNPALLGAGLAMGAAVFIMVVGVVIAAGGSAIFARVTFASPAGITIRAVTGVVLIVLGLSQAEILGFSMHRFSRIIQPRPSRIGRPPRSPLRRLTAFGFGYLLAGFG